MCIHSRVSAFLNSPPSWVTLDPEVVARGRTLVLQRLTVKDSDHLRGMLAWFDRPEIKAVIQIKDHGMV